MSDWPDYRDDYWTHDKATCQCTRCRGFQPGHKLSAGENHKGGPPIKHGAYLSPLKLAPEAEEIAEIVRPLMPISHPSFEGTLQSYCVLLARINRAHKALEDADKIEQGVWDEEADGPKPVPASPYLSEDLRKWMSSALKHATALGLTPQSAAAILRDTTGGRQDLFKPPTQGDLAGVSLPALRKLRAALTEALESRDDVIDAEVM